MKKILTIIAPSILTYTYIFIDSHFPYSKWILIGIYILFPIMFIAQTIISFGSIKNMLIGFLLLSLSIIVPINEWYKVGSMIVPIIIYSSLGIITFFLSKTINTVKRKWKK
ncbi:hypothetical protein [Clostridium saccharobutylicum]|uniref:Uncharacterized protein n=1 Tax=Clostridium saccharobutylicum DSM 13864 TaxID=1345695 RepID=U5MLM1_CLOSA|nr:hypothetical protein [Clostridium saccharobutylicum]AGX41393.1 hypothetical protein CLSA_c03430 [Clostridium saccharobutylicum DSM 13864]AQR88674.1 hypothetical protein CLOSC_03380 [Clostridium saccharobutylicum]AQR98572.1 hypothetical protein CSACC_03380 [Clostridium saccharobutylicum]AQS12562.1 hypothetical protein CLOSACC_03380 [Clostridium saccharobutylicum]MBA2905581.1 hypothetical protein [Clostridium saccharobutylicum]